MTCLCSYYVFSLVFCSLSVFHFSKMEEEIFLIEMKLRLFLTRFCEQVKLKIYKDLILQVNLKFIRWGKRDVR